MDATIVVAIIGLCTTFIGVVGTNQYHKRRRNGSQAVAPCELMARKSLCASHDTDLELLKRIVGQHDTDLQVLKTQLEGIRQLFEQRFNQVDESLLFLKKRLSG